MITLILFWMVWIFNGLDYETYEVQLVDEDMEGAQAVTMPSQNLILIEEQAYPYTYEGCDVMKHEMTHVHLMYQGYSSSMHHAIMKVTGTYC